MTQDKIWEIVQAAWATKRHRHIARTIGNLSGLKGSNRNRRVILAGLDHEQGREAFFARLAQMRKR